MKKTCNKCKALEDIGSNMLKLSCELGYAQDKGVPMEKCPKPLTTKQLYTELQKQKNI